MTSKRFDDAFLPHGSLELYRRDFFACKMMRRSSLVMVTKLDAKSSTAFSRSVEMDG